MNFINHIKTWFTAPETPDLLFTRAKSIYMSVGLFSSFIIDDSIKNDRKIMDIINLMQNSNVSNEERRECQKKLIKIATDLLEKCLDLKPDHAPAYLLYVTLKQRGSRAKDRPDLIKTYEKFLPHIDSINKESNAFLLIKQDIKNFGSHNYFNKVERHLADFYYELGNLYYKEKLFDNAIIQFEKTIKLMPVLFSEPYLILSDIFIKQGKTKDALNVLKKGIKKPFKEPYKTYLINKINSIKVSNI